jgi:hypothetical protein
MGKDIKNNEWGYIENSCTPRPIPSWEPIRFEHDENNSEQEDEA